MRLLLDTNALIWALSASRNLPPQIRRMLADRRNEVFVSTASLFEIACKRASTGGRSPGLGAEDAMRLIRSIDFAMLDVGPEHAAAVESLAISHGDPFDRLLLAQAQIEGLQLVTHDENLAAYDKRTILF